MHEYLDRVQPLSISKALEMESSDKMTPSETHAYRSLAGALLYLGQAVLLQACMTASKMQQKLEALHVSVAIEANSEVCELRTIKLSVFS